MLYDLSPHISSSASLGSIGNNSSSKLFRLPFQSIVFLLLFICAVIHDANSARAFHNFHRDELYEHSGEYILSKLRTNRLSLSATTSTCSQFPQIEFDVLQDLYVSAGGKNWNWNKNYVQYGIPWNFTLSSNNPCSQHWQGIQCLPSNCTINQVVLVSFNLVGTLPNSITNLANLTALHISYNAKLRGPIPPSIGNMTQLQYFDVRSNAHTGKIPASIVNLIQLQYLYIQLNFLTGTIPKKVGQMTEMLAFDLRSNLLTGPIPPSVTNMTKMLSLYLYVNTLTGTFPNDIGKLSQLQFIDCRSNRLTGTIPHSITNLSLLEDFFAYNNYLSGPLPQNLSLMTTLQLLVLDNNFINGEIPADLYFMPTLSIFSITSNSLSGTLAHSLKKMKLIVEFCVNDNYLSGLVPTDLSNLFYLVEFRLDSNYLYGPLPSFFQTSPRLEIFNVSDNYISGRLPTTFHYSQKLEAIDLSKNFITGPIGDAFANLPMLILLILRSNVLTGNLDSLVTPSIQAGSISVIDVSDNAIEGSIPSNIFQLRNITSFVAAKNCITGSLPSNICNTNHTLENLILDGIHSATYCQHQIFPFIRTYYLVHTLESSLPACLFESMSELITLHLSGNGIRGSIPELSTISSKLQSLSLSHNQLTGTIPKVLLDFPWFELDLSFNKLNGSLSSDIPDYSLIDATNQTTELYMNINRLSGDIPHQILQAPVIEMLQGNIFQCNPLINAKETLPNHDPYMNSYACGSNAFDSTMYLWFASFGSICCIAFFVWVTVRYYHHREKQTYSWRGWIVMKCDEMKLWWMVFTVKPMHRPSAIPDEQQPIHSIDSFTADQPTMGSITSSILSVNAQGQNTRRIYELGVLFREIRYWCGTLILFFLCTSLPLYCILSTYYGTYEFQYAWTVSIGFLTGSTPSYILLIYFIIFLWCLYSRMFMCLPFNIKRIYHAFLEQLIAENAISNRESFTKDHTAKTIWQDIEAFHPWYMIITVMFTINIIFVVGANMGYVYFLSQSVSTDVKQILTLLLTVYKLVWNNVCVGYISHMMRDSLSYTRFNYTLKEIMTKQMLVTPITLWISLFNNIIAPILAVAFISPDCFYYAIVPNQDEDITIQVPLCTIALTLTSNNTILTTTLCHNTGYFLQYDIFYSPPYTYSYQCASTLLVSFAEIFMLRFILSCILFPVLILIGKVIQEWIYLRYGVMNPVYQLCTILLPTLLRPLSTLRQDDELLMMGRFPSNAFHSPANIQKYILDIQAQHNNNDNNTAMNTNETAGGEDHDHSKRINELIAKHDVGLVEDEGNEESVTRNTTTDDKKKLARSHRHNSIVQSIHSQYDKSLRWFYSPKVHFNITQTTIVIAVDVAILLTFGTVFPPLAVVGAVSMFIKTILEQIYIGRLVTLANTQWRLTNMVNILNEECRGVSKLLLTSLSSLSFVITCFWSWFVYDSMGDEFGFDDSIWVFPILPMFALFIPLFDKMMFQYVIPNNTCLSKTLWMPQPLTREEHSHMNKDKEDQSVDIDHTYDYEKDGGKDSVNTGRFSKIELTSFESSGIPRTTVLNPLAAKIQHEH